MESSSADASITIGLEVSQSSAEEPTLVVRGQRPGGGVLGKFKPVNASVAQIPCPGDYHFEAAQENSENGNSLVYGAQIALLNTESQPPGARCGVEPPPRPGHLTVTLDTDKGEPFLLEGTRHGVGLFYGSLLFHKFLECDRTYRLETKFDLAGWNRRFDFDVRVIEVEISPPGRKAVPVRC